MHGEALVDQAFLVPLLHHVQVFAVAVLAGSVNDLALGVQGPVLGDAVARGKFAVPHEGVFIHIQRDFNAQLLFEGGQHFVPVIIGFGQVHTDLVQEVLTDGRSEVRAATVFINIEEAPAVSFVRHGFPLQDFVGIDDGHVVGHQIFIILQVCVHAVRNGHVMAGGINETVGDGVVDQVRHLIGREEQVESFTACAAGGMDPFNMDARLFLQPLVRVAVVVVLHSGNVCRQVQVKEEPQRHVIRDMQVTFLLRDAADRGGHQHHDSENQGNEFFCHCLCTSPF